VTPSARAAPFSPARRFKWTVANERGEAVVTMVFPSPDAILRASSLPPPEDGQAGRTFGVTLTVEDANGAQDVASTSLTLGAPPPKGSG
jgi:hypothetical protein